MARSVEIKLADHLTRSDDQTVWEELEQYLFQGFLTVSASAQKQTFVFKSLNHHELQQIDYVRRSLGSTDISNLQSRASFVAYSVLFLNGNAALSVRSSSMPKMTRAFMKFPVDVLDRIIDSLGELNKRVQRLHPLVEVYVHENRSRFRWFQTKQHPVHHSINTGFLGTELLGMNFCQQTWTALNQMIDRKEETERDWANAKFIGGCMAGKAIRGIEDKDRSRLEREREDREEKKIEVLRDYINRTSGKAPPPILRQMDDGRVLEVVGKFAAETREELADQLSAALSGEKDIHDLIVEKHAEKFRATNAEIEKDRLRLLSSSASFADAGTAIAGGGSRVLRGKDEADAMVQRLASLREAGRVRTVSEVDPSGSDDPGSQ